ncbi:ABC transporter ATP-binding protein [Pelagovum pacificum]|uniref:ATP-binding cassette domain-containing protein n=1 Tax=Pelagovum pacificum TaxID=2588711 RepID=A0A5C5G7A6_9RHOB|nr:ATP-binding cassette domain-containing protein [Pelagovum pacificum]QQA41918.1 ATP-binding cassette domain-containing protein [Pelagovum pacificum]TNY30643.1 ATP-binding cassette domain-containing protein [Pelagovum pacificum]
MIDVEGLRVSLSGSPVLKDITTTVPKGRLTALVGPNGAGKSTLLAALGRLEPVQAGTVSIGGKSIASYAHRELALTLSILRQDTHIAPRLTVEELVQFGRYPHSQGRRTAEDARIVARAVERLTLGAVADRHLDTLSGGQRQRALLAMVLAQQTPVILLDEPLNNLDPAHARSVMRLAREETDAGRTVVIVLHDLTVAARYADHVIALKDGRLAAEGPTKEIMRPHILSRLYDTEVAVETVANGPVVLAV